MRQSFIVILMSFLYLNLFATAHQCYLYKEAMGENFNKIDANIDFIPDWFDHIEFADGSSFFLDQEFLQEHGGRAGKLVLRRGNQVVIGCSGTLIGKKYFITAGHCALVSLTARWYNIGVLFGYQIADSIGDNDSTRPSYPRVSLHEGYLDDHGTFKPYGEADGYLNYTEHPAFFPIKPGCNIDGSVEHGWGRKCPIGEDNDDEDIDDENNDDDIEYDDNDEEIPFMPELMLSSDFPIITDLSKTDYAIYELDKNSDLSYPADGSDPWPWVSQANQLAQNTLHVNLVMPWELPDNTNGHRGWARVNTAILQNGTSLNIIGGPFYARYDNNNFFGLKVANSGSVVDGKGRGKGIRDDHNEDLLIFEGADIQNLHSGSSVIDSSGRLAGVVSWIGCAPGKHWVEGNALYEDAQNYATPMWKICRVSQIIKNAARDQDCNGQIDWWDFIERLKNFSKIIKIGDIQFWDLDFSSSTSEVQNYRYDVAQQKVITETREIPAYTYQVAWSGNGDFFYLAKQSDVFYLFKNGTALGIVSNAPEIIGSSAFIKGDDIYLAGGNTANIRSNDFFPHITKISSDGQNGYSFSMVADLPADFEDIRIFSLGNDIYVSGNTNNSFVIYELVANNQGGNPYTLVLVSDTSQPVRKDYNLTAADGKIIVSGGATNYISNVMNVEEGNPYPVGFAVYNNIIMLEPAVSPNWGTIAENINDKLILLSVTAIDDGKLVIVNPFITVGNTMQKIVMDLSDIPINGDNLRVEFEFDPLVYCLNEAENTLAGGIETSGTCVSFTHPFYNSFSAGTTVYSVAGKGNRLYAGTNDSIKIYDISDPDSPVLISSFSTNNARVNDLEIEGDILFAATSKGLYKLDASDPDELEQILFVSTGSTSQNEIELYDGKVYVGDDNGIKIRDKETLSVLLSANSGQVYDFAIENGEIAMFRSSFWNSGIQFRNAETLVETAYDYTSCNDVEVESFNGKLYLACDNYNYSFEANNGYIYFTQLSGDKRDLRENYTYNGYTYTPDGNYIRLSTNEEVPAICGNGIIEGDEVCDGTPIDCTELDENYVSGIAACNSTCDGYILDNCTAGNGGDGW